MKNNVKTKKRTTPQFSKVVNTSLTFDLTSYKRVVTQIDSILESQKNLFSSIDNKLDVYKNILDSELFKPSNSLCKVLEEATKPSKALQMLVESMNYPSNALVKTIQEMTKPQKLLVNSIEESLKSITEPFSKIDFTSYLSSISEIELSLATNLVVKTELLKPFEGISNGVSTNTAIIDKRLINNGEIGLRVQKDTATISTQIQYQKFEMIDTKLSIIQTKVDNFEQDITKELKERFVTLDRIIEEVENDPFKFFKVKSFEFIKEGSTFVINNVRKISLVSGTIQDYICQILFSGIKELGEEWYWEDIFDEMVAKYRYEGKCEMTWKSMQDAIGQLNIKIATETTIKDAFLTPRSEIIQLNPLYFSSDLVRKQ
ncbi:MAG TPA: hypothetical protein PKI16_00065 [Candidatus Dojkabacteria bacterium]|nr:hypothetical protein [Candidatus Dojkabacteria bacterium]